MNLELSQCRKWSRDLQRMSNELFMLLHHANPDWQAIAGKVDEERETLVMLDIKSKKRVVLNDERWKDLDSESVVQREP